MNKYFILICSMILIGLCTSCSKDIMINPNEDEYSFTYTSTKSNEKSGANTSTSLASDSSVSATTTKAPVGSGAKPASTTKNLTTAKKPTTTKSPSTSDKKTYPLVLPNASQLSVIENEVIRLMNVERQSLGVAALTSETLLIQGARIRAAECKQASTFGHTRPKGIPWSTIFEQVKYGEPVKQRVSDDGINWRTVIEYDFGVGAENLGSTDHSWDSSSDTFFEGYSCTTAQLKNTAKKLFEGWKASSGHYDNMKNAKYTKTGVGLYVCKYTIDADGSLLDGYECIQFIAITLLTSK